MIPVREVTAALGGRRILRHDVSSLRELNELVQAGLPKAALEHLIAGAPADIAMRDRLRRSIAPRATLARRRGRLTARESERVERLARIVATATYVWNDRRDAWEFLRKPHPMLGDRTPVDYAATELGAREVEDLLWRLHYGIAA